MATSTKLNKTEQVIKWASSNKIKKMANLTRELSMSEPQVMRHIRRMTRKGLVQFSKVGKQVQLHAIWNSSDVTASLV